MACLGLGFVVGRFRQQLVENRGEAAVRRLLVKFFSAPDYHLLNNVTLPTEDGTTQVDHVLVSRFGIFVIESKHYSGWLFARADAAQWTQEFYQSRYKFQNPIHQNRKHIAAIANLLDFQPSEHIHSIVVFTGDAMFKTERPAGVLLLSELMAHINAFDVETITQNRLQFCVGRLECCRLAITKQTDVEHAEHLRRKFGDAR
jgi:restriction system protein